MTASPHASDGFKTCSCGCYCKYKSRSFFSIWPPAALNILYFLVHAIDGLGEGYRRNTQNTIRCRQKVRDPHTEQNTQNRGGRSPTVQAKPEAQHLAWLGRASRTPCSHPNTSHLRATVASLAECTQLQQHHTELAADRARERARADAQRQKEHDRVRKRLRSASRLQPAGGVGRERERESKARRRQSAGDIGRERKRESATARR